MLFNVFSSFDFNLLIVICQWLANNYENLQKGDVPVKNTIEFPKYGIWGDDRSLFTTIHNADLNNAKIK